MFKKWRRREEEEEWVQEEGNKKQNSRWNDLKLWTLYH